MARRRACGSCVVNDLRGGLRSPGCPPTSRTRAADPRLGTWRTFLHAHARLTRRLDEELRAAHDLSLAEYDALLQLAKAPGRRLRMSVLADRVLLSRSGITRLVDRLGRRRHGRADDLHDRRPRRRGERSRAPAWSGSARASTTHLDGVRRYFLDSIDRRRPAGAGPRPVPTSWTASTSRSRPRPRRTARPTTDARRVTAAGRVLAGTSGFSYPGWVPRFYPPGSRSRDLLSHYASRLPACELNNTFYARPDGREDRRAGAPRRRPSSGSSSRPSAARASARCTADPADVRAVADGAAAELRRAAGGGAVPGRRARSSASDDELAGAAGRLAGVDPAGAGGAARRRGTSTRRSPRCARPAPCCARPTSTSSRTPPDIRRTGAVPVPAAAPDGLRRRGARRVGARGWCRSSTTALDAYVLFRHDEDGTSARPRRGVRGAGRARPRDGLRSAGTSAGAPAYDWSAGCVAGRDQPARDPSAGPNTTISRSASAMSWNRCGTPAATKIVSPGRDVARLGAGGEPRPAREDHVDLVLGVGLLPVDGARREHVQPERTGPGPGGTRDTARPAAARRSARSDRGKTSIRLRYAERCKPSAPSDFASRWSHSPSPPCASGRAAIAARRPAGRDAASAASSRRLPRPVKLGRVGQRAGLDGPSRSPGGGGDRPDLAAASVALDVVTDGLDSPLWVDRVPDGSGRLARGRAGRHDPDRPGRRAPPGPVPRHHGPRHVGRRARAARASPFPPGFGDDHATLFVHYSDRDGDTTIAAYDAPAGSTTARPGPASGSCSRSSQPYANHNGGWIGFDSTGMLLIGLGDGGRGRRPREPRLEPRRAAGQDAADRRPERRAASRTRSRTTTRSSTRRTPARRSSTTACATRSATASTPRPATSGSATSGQNAWEEVDVAPADARGLDFGWRRWEGWHCYDPIPAATRRA